MKLIKPSFEILEQGFNIDDIHKHIELCGRTCYKSTDKITESSAKPFVDRMINSKHLAMLEHGTIYLEYHVKDPSEIGTLIALPIILFSRLGIILEMDLAAPVEVGIIFIPAALPLLA